MYKLIRTEEEFNKIKLDLSLPVHCDTETSKEETTSKDGLYGKVRLIQLFQTGWQEAILIDCQFIDLDKSLILLKDHHLVFHNSSYDLHTINKNTNNLWLPKKVDDTLYLSRIQYYSKSPQGFGFYKCLKYAGLEDDLILSINKKEQQKSDWGSALLPEQLTYAAVDVIYLEQLYNTMTEKTFNNKAYQLDMYNLEQAVQYTRRGMPINRNTVKKLRRKNILKLEETMTMFDDPHFNPNSSKQCTELLGTSSSAKEVLKELSFDGDTRAENIMNARSYTKMISFLDSYEGDDDNLRGFFNPSAAITSRFSCTGGSAKGYTNLQNIPEILHSIIEAPPGHAIVYKDYSGLELRMATCFVGESTMAEMMLTGKDMHTETGKYLFSIDRELTETERAISKTFTFSLIYGCSPKTVWAMLRGFGIRDYSLSDIKTMVNRWFNMYHIYSDWHTLSKGAIKINGYLDITTLMGRKIRAFKFTDSVNFPIQGSSAEVTKMSLAMLFSRYPNAPLINTIHDSNILCVPENDTKLWGERLSSAMVDAWDYVIKDSAYPEIPMPHGYEAGPIWTFH